MENPEIRLTDLVAIDVWIRNLARHLVRNEDDAADVAQDAWIRFLLHRPDRRGSIRRWMTVVVRNLARSHHRKASTRYEREQSVAGTVEVPSVAELWGQEQVRRKIANAVFALDEPYRTSILLRYFHDHSPIEIANRLGVSDAAIETRLRRGLQKLRSRLDADFVDRKTWCALILPWIRYSGSSTTAAGATATTTLTGALAMGIKMKLALAAAAALVPAAAYVCWPQDPETGAPGVPVAEESRPVEKKEHPPTPSADVAQTPRIEATTVPEPTSPPKPARPPAPRQDDVDALAADLQKLIESGSRSSWEYTRILKALGAIGTPKAIGVVLACMENERCDFSHRPEHFAEVLANVEDERIYPAARRVIERNLEQGLDSWSYTEGYLKLAAKGGREGAVFLLSMLRGHHGRVAMGAAKAVRDLKTHELADQFMATLLEGDMRVVHSLPESLASWRNPDVTAKLTRIAQSPTTPARTKQRVYRALAGFCSGKEIKAFANGYWSAPSPADRAAIVGSLQKLGQAGTPSDRGNSVVAALQVLQHALRESDPHVWRSAVSVIGDRNEFKTRDILVALEQLHASVTTEEDRRCVAGALNQTRRFLR